MYRYNLSFNLKLTLFLVVFVNLCSILQGQSSGRPKNICPDILRKALNRLDSSKYPNPCDILECQTDLDPNKCPLDTIYEDNVSMCGCCPGCVKYLGPGASCGIPIDLVYEDCEDDLGPYCPIKKAECWPGTECNPSVGNQCTAPPDPTQMLNSDCLYKKLSYQMGKTHYNPSCLEGPEGYYAPKQCKGDYANGICFCADRMGKRIFGRSLWKDSANMTCDCSRNLVELKQAGIPATLHCTPNGNYERLQCDKESGLCFCVDQISGNPSGGFVEEKFWKELPCFNDKHPGYTQDTKYLRICESEWVGGQLLESKCAAHGTVLRSLSRLTCDADGSHASKQLVAGQERCQRKNGEPMEYMQTENEQTMNCQCARDVAYNEVPDSQVTCNQNTGNYPKAAEIGEYSFCFDSDGFNFPKDGVPTQYMCCLLGLCQSTDQTPTRCTYEEIPGINPRNISECPVNFVQVYDWEPNWTIPLRPNRTRT